MRIQQNGQSNILLDNIESIEAITPVIYRRRERLLDEELDDGKDIITSKTTMESQTATAIATAMTTTTTIETAKEATEVVTIPQEAIAAIEKIQLKDNIQEEKEKETTNPPAATAAVVVVAATKLLEHTMNRNMEDDNAIVVSGNEKTDNSLEIKMEAHKPSNPINYDNTSKLSGTQSSSISENIDFQETVILRRQQLSRVAEWVQNNTHQMEIEQQQQQQNLNTLNHCDASVTEPHTAFSTFDQLDSVSVEKLSMDSGYKTTPQLQPITNSSQDETIKTSDDSLSPKSDLNNQSPLNFPETANSPKQHEYSTPQTYYRRTSRSGLPVAYTAAQDNQDNSSQCSQILPEQPTCDILNYKYYPNDSDKSRAIKAELHTTTQHVDIAQMEYNVKQFLLKQNEWSMRSTRPTTQVLNSNYNYNNNNNSNNINNNTRQTSIRHIKLFSSSTAGIGPGKGERVRTTLNQHNSNTPMASNHNNNTLNNSHCTTVHTTTGTTATCTNATTATTTNGSMPQRTETNL